MRSPSDTSSDTPAITSADEPLAEASTEELYTAREYELGACFGCQCCFVCGKSSDAEQCSCDKSYGPRTGHRASETKGFRFTGYAYKRKFQVDGDNKNNYAAIWHRTKNTIFGYGLDFDEKVELYLCGVCNSELTRNVTKENKNKAKEQKKMVSKENPLKGMGTRRGRLRKSTLVVPESLQHEEQHVLSTPPMSRDASTVSDSQSELPDSLRFKLAIKLYNGTQLPAQWITVDDVSLDVLKEAIMAEVISAHDENTEVDEKDLVIAYKYSTANGLGTAIKTEEDFVSFCKEYVDCLNANKNILINVSFTHTQPSGSKRKKKQVCLHFLFWLQHNYNSDYLIFVI
ncbi:MAG TPA: hypothetical protein VN457_05670 [Chlamydiales bacterium]|nr:hypothetical protein [Chlamydiales bacterium]